MTTNQFQQLQQSIDKVSQQVESLQESVNDRFDKVDSRMRAMELDIRIIKMALAPDLSEVALKNAMAGFTGQASVTP